MGMERRRRGRKEAHNANPQPPPPAHPLKWEGEFQALLRRKPNQNSCSVEAGAIGHYYFVQEAYY